MVHGQRLAQLAQASVKPEEDEGQVPMWDFSSRQFVETWWASVQALGLGHVCQTPYQARHGGHPEICRQSSGPRLKSPPAGGRTRSHRFATTQSQRSRTEWLNMLASR